MSNHIKGNKYPNSKPNTSYSSGRICVNKGCNTVISKYNKFKHCNKHKPKIYPRIKGRTPDTTKQKPLE